MITLQAYQYLLIALGTFLAGGINALAGGGTLITFSLLTAVGLPPVSANMTNTVALCPGYFGATIAQLKDLQGQKKRLFIYLPAAVLGGIIGALLLQHTGEKSFKVLIPYLILLASLLLALGEPIRRWLARLESSRGSRKMELMAAPGVLLSAVYGGYFGAGLSVILLSVLGSLVNDSLTRLNALKQILALAINVAAAVFFVFSGKVHWWVALVMAFSSLAGGLVGGKFSGKVSPAVLRWVVVGIGLTVSIIYFIKG